ncbi:MAG: hypothetical protein RL262_1026 [Bacteroidota bacterium]
MHPMKKYLFAFIFSVVLFACSPNNVTIDSSVVKMMDSAGLVGSFALLENGTGKFTIANLSHYKDSASSPLSSFNHNQASWVSMDSTPYYQNIINQLGRKEILKIIDSIHYGKGVVSANMNEFWKDGSLKITADEQLGLIKRAFFKDLPFQKRSQEIFKKMMVKEENSNYTLSYIHATDSTTNNSWVLGFEEENTHIYFFVLHTTGKTAAASNNSVTLLKKILLEQGFLQGLR